MRARDKPYNTTDDAPLCILGFVHVRVLSRVGAHLVMIRGGREAHEKLRCFLITEPEHQPRSMLGTPPSADSLGAGVSHTKAIRTFPFLKEVI